MPSSRANLYGLCCCFCALNFLVISGPVAYRKLLVDMSPEELVGAVDFHWITDALTPEEAVAMLKELQPTKTGREAEMLKVRVA